VLRANPNPNANPNQVHGASYDVREVVRAVLQRNASSVIALKLDVEGLCSVHPNPNPHLSPEILTLTLTRSRSRTRTLSL